VILVDRPVWPAHGQMWAHLVSDVSFDELHRFAERLGLPQRSFHRDHYDLPASRYDDAVAAGAAAVDSREIVARLIMAGLRRRPTRPREDRP
jgi:hypothetical protein